MVEGKEVGLCYPRKAIPQVSPFLYAFYGCTLNLSRYGNPSQLPSTMKKEYAAFSQHFITVYAPEIFKLYLNQINLYNSEQVWLSKKSLYHIFSFYAEWYVACLFELPYISLASKHQA